mmetsp:Transcript_33298/g.64360  ORF Transcript_33298/g.64360 Transcript_33298/m.64360 type:complete len:487 (-) Transcript_33298:370-1830(-)
MNRMHGAFFSAFCHILLIFSAPEPAMFELKSLPTQGRKQMPASPAMAFASKVLPHPGGPVMSTPFGHLARTRPYFLPSFKKSTISVTSFLRLARPATSSNETSGTSRRSYLMPWCSSSSSTLRNPGRPTLMLFTPSNAFDMMLATRYMDQIMKMVRLLASTKDPACLHPWRTLCVEIGIFFIILSIFFGAILGTTVQNVRYAAVASKTTSKLRSTPAVLSMTSLNSSAVSADVPSLLPTRLNRPNASVLAALMVTKRSRFDSNVPTPNLSKRADNLGNIPLIRGLALLFKTRLARMDPPTILPNKGTANLRIFLTWGFSTAAAARGIWGISCTKIPGKKTCPDWKCELSILYAEANASLALCSDLIIWFSRTLSIHRGLNSPSDMSIAASSLATASLIKFLASTSICEGRAPSRTRILSIVANFRSSFSILDFSCRSLPNRAWLALSISRFFSLSILNEAFCSLSSYPKLGRMLSNRRIAAERFCL